MEKEELLRRRDEKIAEVFADIEKLKTEKFKHLENVKKLEKNLQKEIDLMKKTTDQKLENHLTTCNYAFYKSVINEIENIENVTAVMKTYKRNEESVAIDIVTKNPHCWIKMVNRPAKTILIEYRDGKRNGDVIAQLKQHIFVSRIFNNPKIKVLFKNGIITEMAEKLERKGIEVIGERVDKNVLKGKWDSTLMERLSEEQDSDWEENDEEVAKRSPALEVSKSSQPLLNLDISAVMLLTTNMCEPGGTEFEFVEKMLNCHVINERKTKAKPPILEVMQDHQLVMSKKAYEEAENIMKTVGGPTEISRFNELSKRIQIIKDQKDSPKVLRLKDVKGVSNTARLVFSCAEITGAKTVTANKKAVRLAQNRNVYFDVIAISPRPLTEQKEATAKKIEAEKKNQNFL